jgi:single-stranded-DNA-specific exonuclease
MTIKWEDVDKFKERFQKYVEEHIEEQQTEPSIHIDSVIDFSNINKRLYHDLKRFSPFGPGNTKPVFATRGVYDFGTSKVVGRNQEHIKLELVDSMSPTIMSGIAFGQAKSVRYIKSRRSFDIAYTIEENVYKHGNVQLQIEDIHFSDE